MDRESFIEGLRKQFTDEIQESVLECEHQNGEVEYDRLSSCLRKLRGAAKLQGLPERDFDELARLVIPEHILVKTQYAARTSKKIAA